MPNSPKSVSHAWDPSCPYCSPREQEDLLDLEERKRKDKERVKKARQKLPGSDKVLNKIYDDERDEMRRVPEWVDVTIQSEQIQELLKKPTNEL